MKKRSITNFAVVLLVAAGIFWLINSSRAATETPSYKVVRSDGKFEIRDYPPLTVAATSMEGADMDGSFMRLFRFITGRNEKAQKIAMTSPVLIDSAPARRTMSFIMPDATTQSGVPQPSAGNVALRKLEAARFATFRFSGGRNARNEAKAVAQLQAWLDGATALGQRRASFCLLRSAVDAAVFAPQ